MVLFVWRKVGREGGEGGEEKERERERGRKGRRKGVINETRGSIKRKYTMSLVHLFSTIYLAISQGNITMAMGFYLFLSS